MQAPMIFGRSRFALALLLSLSTGCASRTGDTPADPNGLPEPEVDGGVAPQPDVSVPPPDTGTTPVPDSGPVVPPGTACEATSPRSITPIVSALPEAGEAPLVDVIKKATSTVRVMIYLMGYGGILDALKEKAAAGVGVFVIMDQGQKDTNQKYYDLMTAAGIKVVWSDPKFPYMHAKFIIADETYAVLSTGNFSKTYSIDKERNYAVRIDDPEDVKDLVGIFDADWNRKDPDLSCTRLLVSPINSKSRIVAHINSATKTLDIESMQFAELDVRNAVAARKKAGVEVRVILANPSWIDANADAATFLKNNGIPVKTMSKPGVHVKSYVVDGTSAYIGSENFSYTSLVKNREVGVIVTDAPAVAPVIKTFETDWAASTSL